MQPVGKFRSSVVALLVANLVPLIGVVFFGWTVFAIMVIYWSENAIIGAINVLKMITCAPDDDARQHPPSAPPQDQSPTEERISALPGYLLDGPILQHVGKLFVIPFFIVHYGIFCAVHGVFVMIMFGNQEGIYRNLPSDPFSAPEQIGHLLLQGGWTSAIVALAASHLFSFFMNYLLGGEFRRTKLLNLMRQPYGRVVVLHLAILSGGFATLFLGNSIGALLILIIGKTTLDLKLHLRQHREF